MLATALQSVIHFDIKLNQNHTIEMRLTGDAFFDYRERFFGLYSDSDNTILIGVIMWLRALTKEDVLHTCIRSSLTFNNTYGETSSCSGTHSSTQQRLIIRVRWCIIKYYWR